MIPGYYVHIGMLLTLMLPPAFVVTDVHFDDVIDQQESE